MGHQLLGTNPRAELKSLPPYLIHTPGSAESPAGGAPRSRTVAWPLQVVVHVVVLMVLVLVVALVAMPVLMLELVLVMTRGD